MSEMRTTTLYNIFEHEKRKLKDHERAYQFIKGQIESGKKNNCVLLKTLDGLQMSEKSIEETFSNKEKNYSFLPEFNLSFISDIKSQINTIINQQIQMMNSINFLMNEKINSIQNNYLLLTQKIDESNEKIDKIVTENERINEKIDKIVTENEKTNEKIDKIVTENERTNEKIENISQTVDEIFLRSGTNSRKINDIIEKVKLIIIKSFEIETKCDNTQNCFLRNEKSSNKNFDIVFLFLKNFKYLNGIIRGLTNECGGNVSDKGVVNVTASSILCSNPRNLVALVNCYDFKTYDKQDSWIKYDFKDKRVSPVYYSIRSCNWNKGWCHPKSWVVEGSNTDLPNDWKVLDSKKDCMSLNNCGQIQCFAIQQSSDFYRFLRIRQTGKNWFGNYDLCISSLEYFGFVKKEHI